MLSGEMLTTRAVYLLRKLRRMSAGEIRRRVAERWQVRRERKLYERGGGNGGRDNGVERPDIIEAAALLASAVQLVPGTARGELTRLQGEFPQVYESLARRSRQRAEAVLSGKWPMLGHSFDLRGEVDWHRDPRTGRRFPRTFYADVSQQQASDGPVDVKYVWELGRQQYLVELSRGWLFTGEERYAQQARDLVLSWIEANPLYEGVHWTSGLEAAMRAISWIWTLAGLADWDGWRENDVERIAGSLFDHGRYLERHLSYYTSPYNHLMGEATALCLLGRLFGKTSEDVPVPRTLEVSRALSAAEDGGPLLARRACSLRAGSWRKLGRRVLIDRGPRQFYGDGFTVEQATGYHFYTLGFLAMSVTAARAQAEPLTDLESVFHRAFRAGAAFRHPDGRWPAIGDVDSARSIPVHREDFWDFRSLCSLGAALFDDDSLNLCEPAEAEEVYWLRGCAGLREGRGSRVEGRKPQVSRVAGQDIRVVLPESGYAVASQGGDWLLFDAGPLGDGLHADSTPSTAHGHADVLQVLYGVDGESVLIDAGMPFYFGREDWVHHFRSPAAHNTLEVQGVAVARSAGGLDWSQVCSAIEINANLSQEAWLARGRVRLPKSRGSRAAGRESKADGGVLIERHLLCLPGQGLWVADYIETDRPRTVRWHWQLPAQRGMRQSVSASGNVPLRDDIELAAVAGMEPLQIEVDRPALDSPAAREAPGYGAHRPATRLRWERKVETNQLVLTYVGRSPMPAASVTVREHNAVLSDADAFSPAAPELAVAEALWAISTNGGEAFYAVGCNPVQAGRAWQSLEGIGGWPAMKLAPTPEPVFCSEKKR